MNHHEATMDRNIVQEPLERVALAIANTHTPSQQILVASQEHWLNAAHAAIAAMDVRELCEALAMATRALEIVNETLEEHGGGKSQNAVTVAQIGREVLAKAGFNEGGA